MNDAEGPPPPGPLTGSMGARRFSSATTFALVGIAAAVAAAMIIATTVWLQQRPEAEEAAATPYGALGSVAATEPALRYDAEYPAIGYSSRAPTDRVARVAEQAGRGEVALERHPDRGYLDALLAALDIDVASQTLVFSKTSLQVETITAATPRAIYFNDDTYVAWVPDAGTIEIASLDPALGPVFYTLAQTDAPRFERHFGRCLRCHDSLSLTGGGVPRFITGSGYVDRDGHIVAHEGWVLTSDRTPLRNRWGGWYVSGYHGDQVHLGNIAVRGVDELQQLETLRNGNLDTLDSLLDTSRYLSNRSDIVALLVLEHQVRVQNAIVRAGWDVRTALAANASAGAAARAAGGAAAEDAAGQAPALAALAVDLEPLVEALFFVDEAPLTDLVEGTSGFAEAFVARGLRDGQGRTLRALDLETRLFEHRLSYLIESRAFAALPDIAKRHVYGRVRAILDGAETDTGAGARYAHLGVAERRAIREILLATSPGFAAVAGD